MSLVSRLKAAGKALIGFEHPAQQSSWLSLLPNTRIDYAGKVGDGLGSNVFMSPLLWIGRVFPEARVAVVTETGADKKDIDLAHPATVLLNEPNPFYSRSSLWMAAVTSWCTDGNIYLLKQRDGVGRVKRLWFTPYWMMEPRQRRGSDEFLTHYDYTPGGRAPIELLPAAVVHCRFGLNPRNTREGYGQLYPLLREVFTDDEAANYVSAILKNGGVPGIIISPKDGATVDPDVLKETKEFIRDHFSGDRRGDPMAIGAATEIQEFGWDPQKLNVGAIRNIPEERVCALLGLPAAVVGFGSGMEQTKVGATMQELVKLAWYGCINPMQDAIAEELTRNLRDDFALKPNQRIIFDRREVRALQNDAKARNEAQDVGVRGGWIKVSEARKAAGLEVAPGDEVYLRSIATVAEGPGAPEPVPPAAAILSPIAKPPNDPAQQSGGKAAPYQVKGLSRVQSGILRAHAIMEARLGKKMEARMMTFFGNMGAKAEAIYLNAAKADNDELRIEDMFQQMNPSALRDEVNGIFGAFYVSVHKENLKLLAGLGVVTDVPDTVAFQIISSGGTRAGLVDLTAAGKRRALQVVREAHEQGLGIPETARLLREAVPAGPWSTSKIRAEVIARTETRYAQGVSSLQCYEATEGIDSVMMIDARLGPTDDECEAMDGTIVTFAEAQSLLNQEHPNGTRDLVPYFGRKP